MHIYWNSVIHSVESQVVLAEHYRMYVWITSKQSYLPQWMYPPLQRKLSVMVWECITYLGVGTLSMVYEKSIAVKYISLLEDQLWPVIVQHYPKNIVFKTIMPTPILLKNTNNKIIVLQLYGKLNHQKLM